MASLMEKPKIVASAFKQENVLQKGKNELQFKDIDQKKDLKAADSLIIFEDTMEKNKSHTVQKKSSPRPNRLEELSKMKLRASVTNIGQRF